MSVPAWGQYDVYLDVYIDDDDDDVKVVRDILVPVTSIRVVHSSYMGVSWLRLGARFMEHKQAIN